MEDVKQNTLNEEKILNFLGIYQDFDWELSIFDEIESTNDYLLNFANVDKFNICLAECQTKGRGRNLKEWQSPKYENIYMSLGFSTENELNRFNAFSLVTALAVHDVLAIEDINTEIKWPNDIYLNNKKVGGILLETITKDEKTLIVVGIGLNIYMKDNSKIDREWTSLALEIEDFNLDRNKIISKLANEILFSKKEFEKEGFDRFAKKFNSLNYLKNKEVSLTNFDCEKGTALDINLDGTLNVKVGERIKKISSGEVSLYLTD